MKPEIPDGLPDTRIIFGLLLAAAVGAFMAFARLPGTEDMSIFWVRWAELVSNQGLREGYRQAFTDYPPGVFILFAMAKTTLGSIAPFVLVKGVIIFAACVGAFVFGLWSRSLGWTVALIFAVLLSSGILAYMDILYLAPLFGALWALQVRRLVLASFCFTVAILLKWQPLVLAPFFLAQAAGLSLDRAKAYRTWIPAIGQLALGAAGPIAVCLVLVEPAIFWRAFSLATSHPALSLQALNANWLIELCFYAQQGGKHVYDVSVPVALVSSVRILFYLIYGFVLAVFALRQRSFAEFVWFGCVGFLVYFLFNIGVHENHLFVPMVLAFALAPLGHRQGLPVAVFLGVMANLNLLLFYGVEGEMLLRGTPMLVASGILSLVNTIFGGFCLARIAKSAIPDLRHALSSGHPTLPA